MIIYKTQLIKCCTTTLYLPVDAEFLYVMEQGMRREHFVGYSWEEPATAFRNYAITSLYTGHVFKKEEVGEYIGTIASADNLVYHYYAKEL